MKQKVVINTFFINIVWYRLSFFGGTACLMAAISKLYPFLATGVLLLVIVLFAILFTLVFTGNRFRKLLSKRAEIIISADEIFINLYNINTNVLEANYIFPLGQLTSFKTNYRFREGTTSVRLKLNNGIKKSFTYWRIAENEEDLAGAIAACIAEFNSAPHPPKKI